jgi:RTX calcium-binding nonapeptide repeat (4 copies)/Domain of unknown function DUF11
MALVPAVDAPAQEQPPLTLETTISPAPARVGERVTFELRVANESVAEVRNVVVSLELVRRDRLVDTSVRCTRTAAVTCPVGTLGPGAEATIAITIRPGTLGVESRFSTARTNRPSDRTTSLDYLLVCTIVGTPGNDTLRGTSRRDEICGAGGRDLILAGGGPDLVRGMGRLVGGAGRDFLFVTTGEDQRLPETAVESPPAFGTLLDGGPGDDYLLGEAGNDRVRGGAGNDEIEGSNGRDRLLGGEGRDRLNGEEGGDSLDGGAGNDDLAGHHGDDVVRGGAGNDRVRGGYFNDSNERFRPGGDDRLFGGPGRDRVVGGKGRDVVDGGPGEDELFGGLNNDLLLARDGFVDELEGRRGFDRARVDSFDRAVGVERISRR